MAAIDLTVALTVIIVIEILIKWAKNNKDRFKKIKSISVFIWKVLVVGYGLWLLQNFWNVIINPTTPITTSTISDIILHPPFIQLILAVTFLWLVVALLNVPLMHIKGINTPFLKFEMSKVDQVVQQGKEDLEMNRVVDEFRWAAAKACAEVNPYEDVPRHMDESDLELFARTMGGIVVETIFDLTQIDYFTGAVLMDRNGELRDHIVFLLPPETQYVVRNAHNKNAYSFNETSVALPISLGNEKAIFYCYNQAIPMTKTDCKMFEIMWNTLVKKSELIACLNSSKMLSLN